MNKLLNNLLGMYKQAKLNKQAEETKECAKKDYTEQYAKVKEIMKEYGYGLSDGGYIYLISKEEPKDEGFQVKFKGDRLRVELDGKLTYSGYGPEAIEDFLKGMFYAKKLSSKDNTLSKKSYHMEQEDLIKETDEEIKELARNFTNGFKNSWMGMNVKGSNFYAFTTIEKEDEDGFTYLDINNGEFSDGYGLDKYFHPYDYWYDIKNDELYKINWNILEKKLEEDAKFYTSSSKTKDMRKKAEDKDFYKEYKEEIKNRLDKDNRIDSYVFSDNDRKVNIRIKDSKMGYRKTGFISLVQALDIEYLMDKVNADGKEMKTASKAKAFKKLCLKRAFHKTAGEFEEMMKLKSTDPKLISYLAKEFGVEESTVSQYTDVSENAEELYNILEQQANKYGYGWDKFEYDEYGDRIDEDDFRGDTDDLEKAVEYLKNNIDKSMFKFEYVGTYEENYLTFSVNEKLIPIEKPIIHITNYTKNYDISFFVESQKAKEEDKAEGIYTEDRLSILIRRTSDEILNEIVNYVNVELPKKIEEQNRKQSSKTKAVRKQADEKSERVKKDIEKVVSEMDKSLKVVFRDFGDGYKIGKKEIEDFIKDTGTQVKVLDSGEYILVSPSGEETTLFNDDTLYIKDKDVYVKKPGMFPKKLASSTKKKAGIPDVYKNNAIVKRIEEMLAKMDMKIKSIEGKGLDYKKVNTDSMMPGSSSFSGSSFKEILNKVNEYFKTSRYNKQSSNSKKKAVLQESENGLGYVLPNGSVVYPGDEEYLQSELKGEKELLEKTKSEIVRLEKKMEEIKKEYPEVDLSKYPDSILFKLDRELKLKEAIELFIETIEDILNAFKNKKMGKQATIKHENGVYNVYSESGKCLGKGYKTKEEAEKRLKQVEYFKNKKANKEDTYEEWGVLCNDLDEEWFDSETGAKIFFNKVKNKVDQVVHKVYDISNEEPEEIQVDVLYDKDRKINKLTMRTSLKQVVISKMAKIKK